MVLPGSGASPPSVQALRSDASARAAAAHRQRRVGLTCRREMRKCRPRWPAGAGRTPIRPQKLSDRFPICGPQVRILPGHQQDQDGAIREELECRAHRPPSGTLDPDHRDRARARNRSGPHPRAVGRRGRHQGRQPVLPRRAWPRSKRSMRASRAASARGRASSSCASCSRSTRSPRRTASATARARCATR